jgi:GNAT superfamily N-acetyltransferase
MGEDLAVSLPRNIRIRPIRPDDWRRLQRFHQRLSDTTIALRFHGAKRELSEPLAHRFANVDGHDNAAFVATTGTWGRIVGVARYSRIGPAAAEVAFVVEDAYQGQGIGQKLMARLRAHALQNGITEFVAMVLPGNTPMLHLLEEAGQARVHTKGGLWEIHVDLLGSGTAH